MVLEQLLKLPRSKVALRIVRVDDTAAEAQFVDLAVEDDLLHGAVGNEAVNVALALLTIAVNAADGLLVVRGVPGRVEDDDAVGSSQRDAKGAGACGKHEDVAVVVFGRVVEVCGRLSSAVCV